MVLRRILTAAATSLALAVPANASVAPFWRSLAHCETGGRWDWGSRHRPGEDGTYEGGLGIFAGTWTLWSGQVGVPYAHAWQAPPAVQVRVAAWGLAHGGFWGCLRHVPRSSFPRWTPSQPWLAIPRLP